MVLSRGAPRVLLAHLDGVSMGMARGYREVVRGGEVGPKENLRWGRGEGDVVVENEDEVGWVEEYGQGLAGCKSHTCASRSWQDWCWPGG